MRLGNPKISSELRGAAPLALRELAGSRVWHKQHPEGAPRRLWGCSLLNNTSTLKLSIHRIIHRRNELLTNFLLLPF